MTLSITKATIKALDNTSVTLDLTFTAPSATVTTLQLSNTTATTGAFGNAVAVKIATTDTQKTVKFTGLTASTSYVIASIIDGQSPNQTANAVPTSIPFFTFAASAIMKLVLSGAVGFLVGFFVLKMFFSKK